MILKPLCVEYPEPMKISVLLPDLRGGGVERIRLELAREFRAVGHEVEFLLMSAKGDLLDEVAREFPVTDLAAPRVRNLVPALARHLRRTRPDALMAAMWPLTVAAPLAARLAGFKGPVLVSEHNILSLQYANRRWPHGQALRLSTRIGYRLADARVGVSRGAAQDMAQLAGMAAECMTVIPNPVRRMPTPETSALEQADALWGSGDARRILTVGSLKAVKNHALLLDAVALLPDRRLMIVGQGQDETMLRQHAARLGIIDRVIFAGFHADPSPFYATADLFVLSSNNEGFGNVIVEAFAAGLPVVSTDCPAGPAEILDNGRYGRLTPVGDAPALARAIEEALAGEPDRGALKRRAADFSPDIAAKQYLEAMGLT